jgi:hypothetical protein
LILIDELLKQLYDPRARGCYLSGFVDDSAVMLQRFSIATRFKEAEKLLGIHLQRAPDLHLVGFDDPRNLLPELAQHHPQPV